MVAPSFGVLAIFVVCGTVLVANGQLCPATSPGAVGICVENCSNDGDCDLGEKCCSNGCGHTCQRPTGIVSVTNTQQCPTLPPGTVGTCVEECSSDEDCGSGAKCCSNGCGHTCQTPAGTGTGTLVESPSQPLCPVLAPGTVGDCVERCSNHRDCGEGGLCCSNGCGHTCHRPEVICPPVCAMHCPDGTVMREDGNGCQLCECVNPCVNKRCPRWTKCKLVQVQCFRAPCPPIPTCVIRRG